MADEEYEIRLEPGGARFAARADEPILNAALRQRVGLRYGCRHGNCSSCKYRLVDGEVDFGRASPYSLSEREREDGWALLCCARALSDLVIENPAEAEQGMLPVLPPVEQTATVAAVEPLSASLWRLRLALESPLGFYPGQFVEVGVAGEPGEWRSYSIASAPSTPGSIELVVKRIPGGAFSGRVETLAPGSALALRGPYGASYLREADRPILFAATGSGIAPILSMLRAAAEARDPRELTFFYGARTRADLVLLEEIRAIEARLPRFAFRPSLSAPTPACAWEGPTGRVTQLVQRAVADASGADAYLCGAPDMCDSIALLLGAKGIPEERVFFDRFFAAV